MGFSVLFQRFMKSENFFWIRRVSIKAYFDNHLTFIVKYLKFQQNDRIKVNFSEFWFNFVMCFTIDRYFVLYSTINFSWFWFYKKKNLVRIRFIHSWLYDSKKSSICQYRILFKKSFFPKKKSIFLTQRSLESIFFSFNRKKFKNFIIYNSISIIILKI